jgi:hypothetical protein
MLSPFRSRHQESFNQHINTLNEFNISGDHDLHFNLYVVKDILEYMQNPKAKTISNNAFTLLGNYLYQYQPFRENSGGRLNKIWIGSEHAGYYGVEQDIKHYAARPIYYTFHSIIKSMKALNLLLTAGQRPFINTVYINAHEHALHAYNFTYNSKTACWEYDMVDFGLFLIIGGK